MGQTAEGLAGIVALGQQGKLCIGGWRKRKYVQHAFGVHLAGVAYELYIRGVALGLLRQPCRRSGVQAVAQTKAYPQRQTSWRLFYGVFHRPTFERFFG